MPYVCRVSEASQFSRRRDRTRAARRANRIIAELCPACGHPWSEHFDGIYDAEEVGGCGECAYEVEHGFREAGPFCQLHVPADVLARAAAARDGR